MAGIDILLHASLAILSLLSTLENKENQVVVDEPLLIFSGSSITILQVLLVGRLWRD